jgi:transcriptional regulator with PAS, ATPase and Fis domain
MTLRILVIAPYKSLADLFLTTSEMDEYKNLHVQTVIFNLQEALNYLRNGNHEQYDVIISRGGTAQILRKEMPQPVIEVGVSAYDMLRIIQMARNNASSYVIVGFDSIIKASRTICDILNYNVPILTITPNTVDEAKTRLLELKEKGYSTVVGDVIAVETGTDIGMNSLLITSGIESVKYALDSCLLVSQSLSKMNRLNQFYKSAIDNSPCINIIMNEDGNMIYSNQKIQDLYVEDLEAYLLNLLPELNKSNTLKQSVFLSETMLTIDAATIETPEGKLFAFYINKTANFTNSDLSFLEIEKIQADDYYAEVPAELIADNDLVEQAIQASAKIPILITGSIGGGHAVLAVHIHYRSKHRANSFVSIDCAGLDSDAFSALTENSNTPLYMDGYTIILKDIDKLSPKVQGHLLSFIKDTELTIRSQLISTTQVNIDKLVNDGTFNRSLYKTISSFIIPLTPICERKSVIPLMTSFLINRYNVRYGKQLIGFDKEALQQILDYDWPENIDEMRRIIRQLVLITETHYISATNVERALSEFASSSAEPDQEEFDIDFAQPLEEIERTIIKHVVEMNNMNQTKAADSLGISRSTLWRKIREK